jgi:hypothetical protein
MKTIYVFLGIVLVSFLVLNSCSVEPKTKDGYLNDFEAFVENIGDGYKDYSPDTWEEKDKVYRKYTESWYLKFKNQLDLKEKVRVKKLAVKYQLYRNGEELKGGLEEGIKALKELGEEFEGLLKDIQVEE